MRMRCSQGLIPSQKSLKRTCDEEETDSKKKKEETKDDSTKSIFTGTSLSLLPIH